VSQAEHGHEVHQNEVAELERPDKLDRLRGGLCGLRSHMPRKKRLRINAQGWTPFSLKGGKMNRFKLPDAKKIGCPRASQIEVYGAGSKITFSTS
jgi:hypothetical protein